MSEHKDQLERIEQKLDMIIRHFNIDGSNKMASAVRKEARERVIKLLEKRKRKTKESLRKE